MSENPIGTSGLKRGLKNRHIQMIAFGGAIGTGLFYGSATSIKLVGPAITLSYVIGGLIIFFIMRALGEMSVDRPVAGSFSYYAYRYWGNFPGFRITRARHRHSGSLCIRFHLICHLPSLHLSLL